MSGGDSQEGIPEDTFLQNWEEKGRATAGLSQDSHVHLLWMKRGPPGRKEAVIVLCKLSCMGWTSVSMTPWGRPVLTMSVLVLASSWKQPKRKPSVQEFSKPSGCSRDVWQLLEAHSVSMEATLTDSANCRKKKFKKNSSSKWMRKGFLSILGCRGLNPGKCSTTELCPQLFWIFLSLPKQYSVTTPAMFVVYWVI